MGTFMEKNITSIGQKEAEFLANVSSTNNQQFSMEAAIQFWGSSAMAKKKLYVLERKGWVARIERGKYIVIPLEAGPDRKWSEDSYLIAGALVQPAAIAYWSAIRHWNWTEQIPRIVYVQTTKRKKNPRRIVFGVQYEFVTVAKPKFFGHVKEWRGGKVCLITDKEKTLIDCADDVDRSGSIEELAKAVREGAKEISWKKLREYAARFPNGAVKKRLGYLFETLVPKLPEEAVNVLKEWQQELTAGISPLLPSGNTNAKISTRWKILVNAGTR
jgi:predicted transcriptional regulator of viral defense system